MESISREQEELLRKWQGRVELARRYQDKHGNTDGRWTKNVEALAGDFHSRQELGEDAIDVNMIRSAIKTKLPPLWITEPHISVKPTAEFTKEGADNIRRAEVTEAEINYWLRELEVRKQVRKVVIDGECTNNGYLYVGYTTKLKDITIDDKKIENVPTIRYKQPFVRRICPKNVLVPVGYDDLDSAPWIDLVFLKPLEHVKARWPETTEDLAATKSLEEGASSQDTQQYSEYLNSDDCKLVEVHNAWDKETGKVYIFAQDHDRFLEKPKSWPYKLEGFPLLRYSPEDIPDEYYGTPSTTYALPQNKEMNAARTALRRRTNKTKATVWVSDEVGDETIESYRSAEDGTILKAGPGDAPVSQRVYVDPGLPLDVAGITYAGLIEKDFLTVEGVSAEQRGSGDPNVSSATASANIEKNVQIRGSDLGDRVRDLYIGTARKLVMILRQFPDEQRSRRIAGPVAGQMTTLTYTLADLEGEFDFEMDFSAMLSDNPATRATQAILNYNLLRADPLVNPEQLLLDIFRSQNKRAPESYLIFLRQPQEELEMMSQGLPVEAHERDDHEAHLQAHDQQMNGLDQATEKLPPQSPQSEKVRLTTLLMVAHVQDHVRQLQRLQGSRKTPGSPVAENMLRNQVRATSGGETQAELGGQPMTPADTVQ